MTREKSKCSAAMLTALLAAIKRGRRLRTNTESFIRAVELGWFADYQIKDLSYDLGLEGFIDELLADAGVILAAYHYRPRRIDRSAGAFEGLRVADMARFLIHLERLGLNVDPTPLVDRLLPQIKQLPAISGSELSVLWSARERHRWALTALYTPSFAHRQEPAPRREDFKTEAGYKIDAYFVGDEVHFLEIRAPRYRYRPEPELTTCEVCGVEWLKGDPASSRVHRREHKERLAVLQPSPDPRFLEALANDAEPELVTATSSKWRQQAMYARALDITKPAHTWCEHCRPGHGGCSIYQQRPSICRGFACQWLIDGLFGDEWMPTRSKMVLRMSPGPGQMVLFVYVDDPTVSRRSPYLDQLRERSARMRVVIRYRDHCTAISPDREVEFRKGEAVLSGADGWFVIVPEERAAELSRDLDRRYARRQPFALNEPGVRFTRGVSF